MKRLYNRLLRAFGVERDSMNGDHTGAAYIVFNPAWPDPPMKWFYRAQDAQKLAEQLSKRQPHHNFFVMKAVLHIAPVTTVRELPGGDEP